jgi:hypothetical protein
VDALVADAGLPNSVSGLRALGRAGIRAYALGPSRLSPGLWSRHAAGRATGDIASAAAAHGPAAVYPGLEATIDRLLELAPGANLVLPWDPASLAPLREKRRLPELCAEHGLAAPATLFDGSVSELREADVPLPAVLKPGRPSGPPWTAQVVQDRAELLARLDGLAAAEPVLVQEPARGRLTSLALVLDRDGRVAASFQEEALRTWPRAAGSFAATVSVAPDDALAGRVAAMLSAVGYWGLAQLDLVAAPGATIVLDVNPRFYACMPLATACGVNLAAAWHAVVEGRDAGTPAPYPIGRRYRWLEGDLYAARHGDLSRLRPGPRAGAGAMWSPDDPLASLMLAGAAATLPLRRRLRGGRVGLP